MYLAVTKSKDLISLLDAGMKRPKTYRSIMTEQVLSYFTFSLQSHLRDPIGLYHVKISVWSPLMTH